MSKVQKIIDLSISKFWELDHSCKLCLQSIIFLVFIILHLIGKWFTKHLPDYA